MTTLAYRTTLLLAAILYGCDGQGYDQWFTDFTCPDFAGVSQSQCTQLTAVNGLYNRDIRGVHYTAAFSYEPSGFRCSYGDFEPATGSECFEKLFGYVYLTFFNSTSNTYFDPLKANWVQTAYGRARAVIDGTSVTADQLIIARTAHGFAWARCAPYNSPSAAPVCFIMTKERHPDVAWVEELEQLAFEAGFTTPFQAVSQHNCPPAIGRRGPTVLTLDLPFF